MDEVFVLVSDLVAVKKGVNREHGVIVEGEWTWWSVWVRIRGIGIRLKKVDIKNWMEARKVRWEA
jgi:hypothetical protein